MKPIYFAISLSCFMSLTSVEATTIINHKKPIIKKVSEKELAASILIAEAGGEGIVGMKAVYEVIRNRMDCKNASLYRIITERNAFSCFNRYRQNPQRFINIHKKHKLYTNALWIINNYKSNTLVKNSNYYHEKRLNPNWSKGEKPVSKIGNHLFFCLVY